MAAAVCWIVLLGVFGFLVGPLDASAGDLDPLYRNCVDQCEKTSHIGEIYLKSCSFSPDDVSTNGSWYARESLYLHWRQWCCRSDCRYHCMMQREKERKELGLTPVKYHGKWPFIRVSIFQEPVSASFSVLNLIMHFHGWLSFYLRPQGKRTYYPYTGLWHIYGIVAMNAWFWSFIFHSGDSDLTEKLDYSAAVAFLGFSLILSIMRTFNVRDEASRVMVSAPLLAFLTTHILYLNFYQLDYGLNMKVCVGIGICQLLLWAVWAGINNHPSKFKLWTVVFGSGLAMLLEIYDFPPYGGYVDAHALWHATTIPLTYIWWSFVKDDASLPTSVLAKKTK